MKSAWLTVLSIIALCAAAVGIVTPQPLCADSWAMPRTETYLSPNGEYRFTVEPSQIGSQLEYFAQEVEAQSDGEVIERPAPIGLLEKRNVEGQWEAVWVERLVNHVAPVDVLVADDGRHIVTFDNWHSVGHGDNVIVIYGKGGALVRSMALTDLVPSEYKDALPHSVSSLRWKTDATIGPSNSEFAIDVLVPGTDWNSDEAETIEFRIALSDGAIEKPSGEAWDAALCAADNVLSEREKAEQERLAFLRDPLTAPDGCDGRKWNRYLREAHARLSSDPPFDASTSVHLVNPPDHPRHEDAIGYFREELIDWAGYPNDFSVVSPCGSGVMATVIEQLVQNVETNALIDTTIYVSVSKAEFDAIQSSLRPTGASAFWLDPDFAIPQRPERIPGSKEEAAAREAYYERQAEEMSEMMDALGAP